MGRRHYRYGSGRTGTGAKLGRTLIYQIVVCLIIVLLVIVIKRMDNAMTTRALETVQTLMNKDYSTMELTDSAKAVFANLGKLPKSVENAVKEGKKEMAFIPPTDQEALAMVFGAENSYDGIRYSAEQELQIYASSGGTVVSISGEGPEKLIRISHGGEVESQYAGCTSVYVKPLEKVKKGQLIASVAPGEQSCLTFSMWKDNETVDPADYISF